MKITHNIPPVFLQKRVRVAVIGAGGTGSNLIPRLAQLDYTLKALGHPAGIHVTVYDDDLVSPANIARQIFYESDIGQNKAMVLVNRLNIHFGTDWEAAPQRITAKSILQQEIVIGCVDTRAARLAIKNAIVASRSHQAYWFDCGNNADSGQVVIGELGGKSTMSRRDRLPTIADLFPDLINPSLDDKNEGPSCSLADAIRKQSLVINPMMAMEAMNLLWTLFRHGSLQYSGKFINLKSGLSSPIRLDTDVWARMGYVAPEPEKPKVEKLAPKKKPKNIAAAA